MEYIPARALSKARHRAAVGAAGFSLIELLVTVAIVGILLAVGTPAMMQFLAEQSAAGNADEFAEALRFARSEAIKTGQVIQMCASADAKSCGEDWSKGWIVQSASRVLRVQNALRAMDSLDSAAVSVSFAATGIATAGSGDYTFTPVGGDSSRARKVNLNIQGRVTVTKGAGGS